MKKQKKSLALNTETIRALRGDSATRVAGGGSGKYTCLPCATMFPCTDSHGGGCGTAACTQ